MSPQHIPILNLFDWRVIADQAFSGVGIGFDIVQISQIENSLVQFGDAFKKRLFTQGELNYACCVEGLSPERLAARFAVKEAVIKALHLSDVGVDWREIEAIKQPEGRCYLQLHGDVAELAVGLGVRQWLLSMSHDGDYAGAVVLALGFSSEHKIF